MSVNLKVEVEKQVQVGKNIIAAQLSKGSLKPSPMSLLTKFRDIKMAYTYAVVSKKYENNSKPLKYYFEKGRMLGYDACAKEIKQILSKQDLRLLTVTSLLGVDIIFELVGISLVSAIIPDRLAQLVYELVHKVLSIVGRKYDLEPESELKKIANALQMKYERFAKNHGFIQAYRAGIGKMIVAYALVIPAAEQSSKEIAAKLGLGTYFLKIQLALETITYLISSKDIKLALKLRIPSIILHVATTLIHENPKYAKFAYLLHSVFNIITVALTPYVASKVNT